MAEWLLWLMLGVAIIAAVWLFVGGEVKTRPWTDENRQTHWSEGSTHYVSVTLGGLSGQEHKRTPEQQALIDNLPVGYGIRFAPRGVEIKGGENTANSEVMHLRSFTHIGEGAEQFLPAPDWPLFVPFKLNSHE